jgi:hypothetical protein
MAEKNTETTGSWAGVMEPHSKHRFIPRMNPLHLSGTSHSINWPEDWSLYYTQRGSGYQIWPPQKAYPSYQTPSYVSLSYPNARLPNMGMYAFVRLGQLPVMELQLRMWSTHTTGCNLHDEVYTTSCTAPISVPYVPAVHTCGASRDPQRLQVPHTPSLPQKAQFVAEKHTYACACTGLT